MKITFIFTWQRSSEDCLCLFIWYFYSVLTMFDAKLFNVRGVAGHTYTTEVRQRTVTLPTVNAINGSIRFGFTPYA